MLNLARKPPLPGFEHRDMRVKSIRSIFANDPLCARTLAWHAAQIIALSRWHPVFSPVEGMRLFLAGVVLWGFANYQRSSTSSPSPSSSSAASDSAASSAASPTHPGAAHAAPQPPPPPPPLPLQFPELTVRLDLLPWNMPKSCAGRGEEWVRTGRGKAVIGVGVDGGLGDRMVEVCAGDGAKEVLKVVVGILGSLRVWGLGGEFKGVLEELVARRGT